MTKHPLGIYVSLMHVGPIALFSSELATEGVVAYDSSLKQNVLVMSVALCFQGDSPMDTKITRMPVPGHACCMCNLKATNTKDRKTSLYVCRFIEHNAQGERVHILEYSSFGCVVSSCSNIII
jgi:hypothetical protein